MRARVLMAGLDCPFCRGGMAVVEEKDGPSLLHEAPHCGRFEAVPAAVILETLLDRKLSELAS